MATIGAIGTGAADQQDTFRRYQELNARQFEGDYDFVIVHDPQPAGMIDQRRAQISRREHLGDGSRDVGCRNREPDLAAHCNLEDLTKIAPLLGCIPEGEFTTMEIPA